MISEINVPMMMPPSVATPQVAKAPEVGGSFSEVLAQVEPSEKTQVVKEQAKKLVAEAFVAPILAKIRADNKAAAPFGPTTAEQRFGPMIDRIVADGMTTPERFPMVKAVERSIMSRIEGNVGGTG